jgi:hypothetical protein
MACVLPFVTRRARIAHSEYRIAYTIYRILLCELGLRKQDLTPYATNCIQIGSLMCKILIKGVDINMSMTIITQACE